MWASRSVVTSIDEYSTLPVWKVCLRNACWKSLLVTDPFRRMKSSWVHNSILLFYFKPKDRRLLVRLAFREYIVEIQTIWTETLIWENIFLLVNYSISLMSSVHYWIITVLSANISVLKGMRLCKANIKYFASVTLIYALVARVRMTVYICVKCVRVVISCSSANRPSPSSESTLRLCMTPVLRFGLCLISDLTNSSHLFTDSGRHPTAECPGNLCEATSAFAGVPRFAGSRIDYDIDDLSLQASSSLP